MSLKIVGAGFGRTGTLSTKTALNMLGFPCYHMTEVVENRRNKSHLDFWNRVANSPADQPHDWDKIFNEYTATVDNPGCVVWKELYAAYPDAKVLVTLHPRGPEAWYQSTFETIYFTERLWQFKLLKLVTPFARKFGNMVSKLIWKRLLENTMENKTAALKRYHEHVEEVKELIPEDRLLIFSVDQGWEPLCKFLEVPMPEEEFPRVNDRKEIKKSIEKMIRGSYFILAALFLILASATIAVYYLSS